MYSRLRWWTPDVESATARYSGSVNRPDDALAPDDASLPENASPPHVSVPDDVHMMETARRRYGAVGAFVAGGMLGLDRILGRKVKEEAPVVWEAAGEPEDIDRGMTIDIDDDTSVVSTPHRARQRVIRRRRNGGSTIGSIDEG